MTRAEESYREQEWFRAGASLSPLIVIVILGNIASFQSKSIGVLGTCMLCMLSLTLSALWQGHALFVTRGVRLAFVSALLLLCLGWGWQLSAYMLLPGCSLSFGYFETAEGSRASLVLLLLPVLTVAAGLAASLATGLWLAWRAGERWSLLAMAWWWLVATIVFLIPGLSMALQGYGFGH